MKHWKAPMLRSKNHKACRTAPAPDLILVRKRSRSIIHVIRRRNPKRIIYLHFSFVQGANFLSSVSRCSIFFVRFRIKILALNPWQWRLPFSLLIEKLFSVSNTKQKSRFYPKGINTPDTRLLFYRGFQDTGRITEQFQSAYFPVRADIQLRDCGFSKHSLRHLRKNSSTNYVRGKFTFHNL